MDKPRKKPDPTSCLELGDGRLLRDGKAIPLTPRIFSMLRYLVQNRDRLITKQELLDLVWPDTHVTDGLVKDYVRKVRRVLEDDPKRPHFIETVRGLGYRFVGNIVDSGASEAASHPVPTIAVLAFADRSDDTDQAYFSAGVAEDIIAALSRFRSLVVIARDSSFLYGVNRMEIDRVARELGVGYVVRGSVRKTGNRVRIDAQLIETANSACLWADRYDRELGDVFEVQDQVSLSIVSNLVGNLEEVGRQRAARKRPGSLMAYECLLLGDWHLRQGARADVLKARKMFERALEIEPGNARAHAELSFSYLIEFWSDWTMAPEGAVARAFKFASKAVALDQFDSRAHLYLAAAYHYGKSNFAAAELEYEKAQQLNPNDYDVFCLKSWLLALSGRAEQGIACANKAIRLSPLTTEDCRVAQCFAAYGARQYDEALRALGTIAEPTNHVNACLAMCYAQLGRDAEAKWAMSDFLAGASREITHYPGSDQESWRRYWATKYPFKNAADLEHLLDGLRKAGLP